MKLLLFVLWALCAFSAHGNVLRDRLDRQNQDSLAESSNTRDVEPAPRTPEPAPGLPEVVTAVIESQSGSGSGVTEPEMEMNQTTEGPPPNPGFKLKVTQAGLNYARNVATDLLMYEFSRLQIPDIHETIGVTDVSVVNIVVTDFPRPTSRLGILPAAGLRWTSSGLEPTIVADYTANMDLGFWSVTKTGTMTVTTRRISFVLDFVLGKDEEGRPTVEVLDCTARGRISVSFEGGWSDALNFGSQLFRRGLRSLILATVCQKAKDEINQKTGWAMSQFSVTETIENEYLLDFHLIRWPEYNPDSVETFHKGLITLLSNTSAEPPFVPPEIPHFPEHDQKMVYVYVTSYLLNSGFYTAYISNRLAINVTADMLPGEARSYFQTSCPGRICLGTVFPTLAFLHPDSLAALDIYATRSPEISMRDGQIRMMMALNADLYVQGTTSRNYMFTINLAVTTRLQVSLIDRKLLFNITELEPTAAVDSPLLDLFGANRIFENMVRNATNQYLKPFLADLGSKGIDLPDLQDVHFIDPVVILPEGVDEVLVIGSDVHYDRSLTEIDFALQQETADSETTTSSP